MQNLTSSILRSYFARWSFPHKSPFASVSKFLEPASDIINSNIEKCANMIAMRYRNNNLECVSNIYGVKAYGKNIKMIGESLSLKKKDGSVEYGNELELKHVGHYDNLSFNQFPIKSGHFEYKELQEASLKEFSANAGETIIDYTFPSDYYLYIVADEEVDIDQVCWIYGNDKYGNILVNEVRLLNNNIAFETLAKFKTLFKVVSPYKVKVFSLLPLDKYHSAESNVSFPKRIANKDGDFILPYVEKSEDSISIYDYDSLLKTPEIYFNTDFKIEKLYLTTNMDLIALDDNGWLVTYKPKHMIKEMPNINGSFNDNRFIYVDDEKSSVGSSLVVNIYPYNISSRYASTQLKISIENDGQVVYLNKDGYLTDDSNTWIRVADMNDRVQIKIPCENKLPYVFQVVTNSGEELFAGSYQDDSDAKYICGNVQDIFVHDREIYVKMDNEYYMFTPRRMVFMDYGENFKVTDADYAKGDLI